MGLKSFLLNRRRAAYALCAVGIVLSPVYAARQACAPCLNQTGQYILDLVNTQSGATRSTRSDETTWTYSIALDGPCTLKLTEEREDVRLNNAAGAAPSPPVRQFTHYLIPAADLGFGSFSTRNEFELGSFMRVIFFTDHATIRRWYGDSPTAPPDAEVLFEASINFGKLDVDIFDVPLRLVNALEHLTTLCRPVEQSGTE